MSIADASGKELMNLSSIANNLNVNNLQKNSFKLIRVKYG
jgi:hypothetical protein